MAAVTLGLQLQGVADIQLDLVETAHVVGRTLTRLRIETRLAHLKLAKQATLHQRLLLGLSLDNHPPGQQELATIIVQGPGNGPPDLDLSTIDSDKGHCMTTGGIQSLSYRHTSQGL